MANFAAVVAARTFDLLKQKKALLYSTGTVFWVKPKRQRLVIVFNPAQINQPRVDDNFAHELSTLLHGHPVMRKNTNGLYLQVGYTIPPRVELTAQPLDLNTQPTPWSLPMGMQVQGPFWIGLMDGDSFLVGGVRGMGKSGFLHGCIQALLHGGKTIVYAWDGKDNAEYLRYYGQENFHLMPMNGLQAGLEEIKQEVELRMQRLAQSGHANIVTYNAASPDAQILPIALVIDEVAEVSDQSVMLRMVKVYRAAGVHPIFATNDPSKASVVAKSNLGTRISFPVVGHADSLTILAHTGAEKLPKVRGRGLLVYGGKLVEFQAFTVTYPQPNTEALEWLAGQMNSSAPGQTKENMAIRELISQGLSDPAIVREIWGVNGGSRFYDLRARVKAVRETSSSSKPSDSDQNSAVEAV